MRVVDRIQRRGIGTRMLQALEQWLSWPEPSAKT